MKHGGILPLLAFLFCLFPLLSPQRTMISKTIVHLIRRFIQRKCSHKMAFSENFFTKREEKGCGKAEVQSVLMDPAEERTINFAALDRKSSC